MEWQKMMLDCGSPLYVCEMPHVHSVASAVLVRVGTRDEEWPKEAGLVHALEHMMFQGAGHFADSGALAMAIEKTGGHLNAWTDEEATTYHNCVPAEFVENAFDTLAVQLYFPRLREDRIGTEMSNIIEEIKTCNDMPMGRAMKLFGQTLFGGHPLGKNTLGLEEALRSFTQEDFRNFHQRFYHEANLLFVTVGAINREKALELFNKYFTGSTQVPGRVVSKRASGFASITSSPDLVEAREIDQANIVIGWVTPPAASREAKVLRHFRKMIGGGTAFPLFQEVRDKRGLCYSIRALSAGYTDAGCFGVYIGTNAERVEEALDAIHGVIADHNTNQALLDVVRDMTSGSLKLSSETSVGMLDRALNDLAHGEEPQSFEEELEEVKSITIVEVRAAVSEYLARKKVVRVMVLPLEKN